jgi:hypothetical protein
LNPPSETVTWYVPGGIAGMLNSPFSFATPSNWAPVATSFATIVAPGITPPDGSRTVPLRDEFAAPCANAVAVRPKRMNADNRTSATVRRDTRTMQTSQS